MDSTAQLTLWSPWMATSQTPWIRSYTPSLPTISTYHQPPLSFTYHTLLHNPLHTTYRTTTPYPQSHGHAQCMRCGDLNFQPSSPKDSDFPSYQARIRIRSLFYFRSPSYSILDFPPVLKIFNFPHFSRTDQQASEE